MPLYEYECQDCQNRFTLLRPFSRREERATCPNCGSERSEPVLSVFAGASSGCERTGAGFS
jgi:putative FmdB family regulatory protein